MTPCYCGGCVSCLHLIGMDCDNPLCATCKSKRAVVERDQHAALMETLGEVEEYLEDYADYEGNSALDGKPNRAMTLLGRVRQVITEQER